MIIKKALEISEEIKKSPEVLNFTAAKKALAAEPELEERFNHYLDILESLEFAELSFENLDTAQQREIEFLEDMFSNNPVIRNYLAKEEELKQMLNTINVIINNAIN